MAITVEMSDDGNVMVVGFSGHFSDNDWPEFRSKCLDVAYPSKLFLDLRNSEEINVARLAMVQLLLDRLSRKIDEIIVLACYEPIRALLIRAGCEQRFKIPEGCERLKKGAECSRNCSELINGMLGKNYAG